MRTVVVTVFHSFVSKNVLNTSFLEDLTSGGGVKVVLVVPKEKEAYFISTFQRTGVEVFGFPNPRLTRSAKFFHYLSKLFISTQYLTYKRVEEREGKSALVKLLKYFFEESFVAVCSENKFARKVFLAIDSIIVKEEYFEYLFEKYKPDLVFATDLFEIRDIHLLREAKEKNILTIGMVRSWDNCVSKGLLRARPDRYLVNNEVLKTQLVKRHGVPGELIKEVGLPQFDSFVNKSAQSRQQFLENLGLDPDKKLIVFAPAGKILSNTDKDIVEILLNAKDANKFVDGVQFFVRNHPHHPADFSKLTIDSRSDLYIQNPGVTLSQNEKLTELSNEDQVFLRNLMAHTDLLIWVATSLCLDALVYDVPQVVLNFDGYDSDRDYYHSVKRYHDEEHMTVMFKHKPFKVANSPTELIEYINMYLHDPSIDQKERELVRRQQLYLLDGKSGFRVANEVKKCL